MNDDTQVRVWEEEVVIPTYLPHAPDKNPMFLESRVYQGSSGKVYPLPFIDRIEETKTDHTWKAVWLENKYLKVMILPEIGGRIHVIEDKTNGYDVIYRQNVIKPALVGLAGPWISGGIEFNWPQHHRPATFLPVDYKIEEHEDGSSTVWCGDHDPLTRMKGMHGVCLHPDRAIVELKVRACNRTPYVQTFLWWANVATRVHEGYQSFFPPDVRGVADHAKRAMSEYPLCEGLYYGVDYGERGRTGVPAGECPADFVPPACAASWTGSVPAYAPNDLSWYANIPVPTSYMCLGSKEGFFGGYDHFREAGIIHYADPHISPGKKQWTWGNHEFGYAWDRSLTDEDGPYIELMAGVYTDNQPDFSYLQPGETKNWSQYWYPIQKIGPAHHANLDAAVRLDIAAGSVRVGVSVCAELPHAVVQLLNGGTIAKQWNVDLLPGAPFVVGVANDDLGNLQSLTVAVLDEVGREIIAYAPAQIADAPLPHAAVEPDAPDQVGSVEELYLIGVHLEQYRHATRNPEAYWGEALQRDPLDARCNNALGLRRLRRGEWSAAETNFRNAIERLTRLNPNPYDGEPYYNLGMCLRFQLDASTDSQGASDLFDEAYAAFSKAAWNQAWVASSRHALAELECRRSGWTAAREHLSRSLRANADNLGARNLQVIVLRRLGLDAAAEALLSETLTLDPLDWWARHLAGETLTCDIQTHLDIAHDLARAGLYDDALALLINVDRTDVRGAHAADLGAAPLVAYTLAWLNGRIGDAEEARRYYLRAAAISPDYCFPYRLEEIAILNAAILANPADSRAPYYLGNLLYDRRRYDDAVAQWELSAEIDEFYSVVWRNLGISYYNIQKDVMKACTAYDRAIAAAPDDARLLFERDQLLKRIGERPQVRLSIIEDNISLAAQRDDLSVELSALYNLTGQSRKAMNILSSRNFQPWEGGEGQALGEWVRTHLLLGREKLDGGDAGEARDHFQAALTAPVNLGEAKHLLANQSDIHYWLGRALKDLRKDGEANEHFMQAATFKGDFQEMSVRRFSEMTYYSALAWKALGREEEAALLFNDLAAYGKELEQTPARIDYFATSLPAMLLFADDIQMRQETTALFLQAQAAAGLGMSEDAKHLLETVLSRDPSYAPAVILSREVIINGIK